MAKSLVIAEEANLAALVDKGKAIEFFFQNQGFSVGDIYTARVENILPSIDAVFVSLGTEKMGFLHASDIPGQGPLTERIWPKQKLLVQIVKEPTSNKGPRVSTDITLIGRFFVLTTENNNIVMSRRISSANERARLKSIATLLKPPVGFGLVVRTEAMGATEKELEEDFRELFLERWKYVIDQFEAQRRPSLIMADSKDLLYRVLRDVFHDGVDSVAVDNAKAAERAKHYLELWSHKPPQVELLPVKKLLKEYGVLDELKMALSSRIELPSGGYMHMQPTEALTVIDVNSGKFTSSRTPAETVLKTNIEAATEIARQLRLRNVGGVIVIDFIDMETKYDRLAVLEHFEKLLETDPAHPQIGRLSDLGLVELTRHRQEKSLFESLGEHCSHCQGGGWVFPIFKFFEENNEEQANQSFEEGLEEENINENHNRFHRHNHHGQHQNKYATAEGTNKYATTDNVNKYATPEGANKYASNDNVHKYSTNEGANKYASLENAHKYASDNVHKYPTPEGTNKYPMPEGTNKYATTDSVHKNDNAHKSSSENWQERRKPPFGQHNRQKPFIKKDKASGGLEDELLRPNAEFFAEVEESVENQDLSEIQNANEITETIEIVEENLIIPSSQDEESTKDDLSQNIIEKPLQDNLPEENLAPEPEEPEPIINIQLPPTKEVLPGIYSFDEE